MVVQTTYWRCASCLTQFVGHTDEDDCIICDENWSEKAGLAGCPHCGGMVVEPWTDQVIEDIRTQMDEIYSVKEED